MWKSLIVVIALDSGDERCYWKVQTQRIVIPHQKERKYLS